MKQADGEVPSIGSWRTEACGAKTLAAAQEVREDIFWDTPFPNDIESSFMGSTYNLLFYKTY